jgi:hypothetical protein
MTTAASPAAEKQETIGEFETKTPPAREAGRLGPAFARNARSAE